MEQCPRLAPSRRHLHRRGLAIPSLRWPTLKHNKIQKMREKSTEVLCSFLDQRSAPSSAFSLRVAQPPEPKHSTLAKIFEALCLGMTITAVMQDTHSPISRALKETGRPDVRRMCTWRCALTIAVQACPCFSPPLDRTGSETLAMALEPSCLDMRRHQRRRKELKLHCTWAPTTKDRTSRQNCQEKWP